MRTGRKQKVVERMSMMTEQQKHPQSQAKVWRKRSRFDHDPAKYIRTRERHVNVNVVQEGGLCYTAIYVVGARSCGCDADMTVLLLLRITSRTSLRRGPAPLSTASPLPSPPDLLMAVATR